MNIKKINIGCGKKKLKGYYNIDIDPQYSPEILGDVRNMGFKELGIIRAFHILEHFDYKESLEVLKQWHGWLASGGVLVIEVPDIERACERFKHRPDWIITFIYGAQTTEWEYHKSGWYEKKLVKVLEDLGFEILNVVRLLRRRNTPSLKISAKKP